jgi:hypothetical protein
VTAPTCSFCGQLRKGGVAGPTPSIYICPHCIVLAGEILETSEDGGPVEGDFDRSG